MDRKTCQPKPERSVGLPSKPSFPNLFNAILAVDSGLKTGLACFSCSGQLLWYRSQNFGSRSRLKKASWQILQSLNDECHLVIEGGGRFADVWLQAAQKKKIPVTRISAEQWRKDLLLEREQRTGRQSKIVALELARDVIRQADGAKPTSLRHDAAEAILIGWWYLLSNSSKSSK